jgi:hypothetical protein
MRWLKKGLVFASSGIFDWMVSHASIPVVDRLNDDVLRIYFGARDAQGRSLPGYIEVEADDPRRIRYVHDKPVLPLGKLGAFDDDGIMPCSIVNYDGRKYLYYIGWNRRVTVPYHLSIGLSVSEDGGEHYEKYSEGPICDRSFGEPYFNTAPCVLVEGTIWKMWYVSCTKWEIIDNHPEPFYNVKYTESPDGIHWQKPGLLCLDYDDFTAGYGRPFVAPDKCGYRMFYSYRSATGYRSDPKQSYRIGYAESIDGRNWVRKDDIVGIDRSEGGWDSEMMCYCFIYDHKGMKYMLYNGNGFGKTGFGYAVLEEE